MKSSIPTADEKKWMAHYWEAETFRVGANGQRLPPSVAQFEARIAELTDEAARREMAGKKFQFLLEEADWRKKQIEIHRSRA